MTSAELIDEYDRQIEMAIENEKSGQGQIHAAIATAIAARLERLTPA